MPADGFSDTGFVDAYWNPGPLRSPCGPPTRAATTWRCATPTVRAARYDGAGTKVANAQATVVWNGQVVHDDVEIDGVTTGHGLPKSDSPGAIRLQDHGDPGENPRYRTSWGEPLG